MHVQGHVVLGGDLPPYGQLILREAGHRVSHRGGVAGKTGVSLAVALQVVGLYHLDDPLDHLGRHMLTDLRAVFPGVKIEVYAEETVASPQSTHLVILLFCWNAASI